MNGFLAVLLNHVSNIVRKTASKLTQYLCNLAFSDQLVAHLLMIGQFEVKLFSDRFKCVAEWTMANIVHQSCRKGDLLLSFHPAYACPFTDDIHQLSCGLEDPNAMSKTRMRGPRIDQFGETELFNSSQSLKWSATQHIPEQSLQLLIRIEYNQVVNGIADSLMCHI